jgi:hypothetical protein
VGTTVHLAFPWRTDRRLFQHGRLRANPAGTFGTVGRNIMDGPGLANVDFGVAKNFQVREQMRLQFRSEFFNLSNRVNLENPNTNASSNQFGLITGAGSPRVVQLALKFHF